MMKAMLILGLFLLISGAILAFGPMSSGLGMLLMLCSLTPFFLAIFLYLLKNSEQSSNEPTNKPTNE
jgi:hypothetical protein